MSYRIRSFRAIVRTTFIEAIQEPAALLVLLTAVLVTSVAPLFHFHAFGEEGRLARDGGLASLLVFGLALGCAAAGAGLVEFDPEGPHPATVRRIDERVSNEIGSVRIGNRLQGEVGSVQEFARR